MLAHGGRGCKFATYLVAVSHACSWRAWLQICDLFGFIQPNSLCMVVAWLLMGGACRVGAYDLQSVSAIPEKGDWGMRLPGVVGKSVSRILCPGDTLS